MLRHGLLLVLLSSALPLWAQTAASTFHAYSWAVVPEDCRHITPFVWFNAKSQPAEVAAASLKLPPGRRAVFSWDMHRAILDNPADVCRTADGQPTTQPGIWPEHGVAETRAKIGAFMQAFKAAGGQLDWFILDYEGGYSNWHMGSTASKDRWLAIQNDPRFAPLAEKLGFSDLMLVCEWWKGAGKYLRWNAVTAGLIGAALRDGVWAPVREQFPQARASNYGDSIASEANAVPDLNGHMQWSDPPVMGTHQAPSYYTWIGQLGDRKLAGDQPFGRTPFAGLLLSLNTQRALQRSSEVPITPWVAWQRYTGDGPKAPPATCANTPYYRELVLHLALSGSTTFLLWNPHPWAANQDPESLSTARDERLLDGILAELEQRVPGADREPLTTEALPWDTKVIATALRVAKQVTWRITVPPGVKAITAKLDGKPLTLLIPDNEPGVWFTHPAGRKLTDLAPAG